MKKIRIASSLLILMVLLAGCAAAPLSVIKDKGIKVAVVLASVDFYEKFECKRQEGQTVCQFAIPRNDELAKKTAEAFREKFLGQLQANGIEIGGMERPRVFRAVIKMVYIVERVEGALIEKEARSLQVQMSIFTKDGKSPVFVQSVAASAEVFQNLPKGDDIAAKQRHSRLLAAKLGNDLTVFLANTK